MSRKLFCQLCPLTYKLSVLKGRGLRRLQWFMSRKKYVDTFMEEPLPERIYQHKSLIRRKLGQVDMVLQDNKAINLKLAAPCVNGVILKPGQQFSFWKLVGNCTESKGYQEGLIIKGGEMHQGIGGGMCQFTNLIHWMALHSPLTIVEHHHHHHMDMFPDFGRQVPFGTGTSIMYNYLDYQLLNETEHTFQLLCHTTDDYLCGELRCDEPLAYSYHIVEENSYFEQIGDDYYRHNEIYQNKINKNTGSLVSHLLLTKNHAKVLYDVSYIEPNRIKSMKETS
ncbi:VanW family protein [Vallitalea pronyensis]|uniref:VanW family protein n=1 Tax=Vallitalea pronyensis TaxID=1348613 RepID=A0A8J8MIF5_9FIRM|nr:VanW family protein [Vallitalea pronyensis]QUI22412.1 VanW family protein [Vallitalea pronyensis]